MASHKLHRWRRNIHPSRFRVSKTFDNPTFICDEPDCHVKRRFNDIFGKYAACHRCSNKFVVKENDWKDYYITCPLCSLTAIDAEFVKELIKEISAPVAELADASDLKSEDSNES